MARAKKISWIKLSTDLFFDSNKVKLLRRDKTNGNNKVLLWIMLLTIAGRSDDPGCLMYTSKIPYTAQDLSDDLNMPLKLVEDALKQFEDMDMIFIDNEDKIHISGWNEFQNEAVMDSVRAYNRQKKAESRAKAKAALTENVNDMSLTSQNSSISISYSNNNNTNNSNTDVDADFEKAWNTTFDRYPNKNKAMVARQEWVRLLMSFTEDKRKEMAQLVYESSKAFVKNYEQTDSYKNDGYKYLKSFDRYLTEDSMYWIQKVEDNKKKLNGSS